jgi:hypothetical protein
MALKKVTYYETTNGLRFTDEHEACEAEIQYQLRQSLINYFDAGNFNNVECTKITDYITDNFKRLKEIVNEK